MNPQVFALLVPLQVPILVSAQTPTAGTRALVVAHRPLLTLDALSGVIVPFALWRPVEIAVGARAPTLAPVAALADHAVANVPSGSGISPTALDRSSSYPGNKANGTTEVKQIEC